MSLAFPQGSWFIGCGNMGSAMVAGWRKAGVDLSGLTVFSPSKRRVEGVRVTDQLPDAPISHCWLGHKPYQIEEVAERFGDAVTADTVILSILAGVECATLRRLFPEARAIVRTMPNLPVSEGVGVIGLYSDNADHDLRNELDALMAPLGLSPWCEKERDLTAISTVAGSGPAYVARFVAALRVEAERLGLPSELALRVALATVGGTALMAGESGIDMASLARNVASPGGSTEAGLEILDGDHGMADLVQRTVEAARRRTEEMAAAARG